MASRTLEGTQRKVAHLHINMFSRISGLVCVSVFNLKFCNCRVFGNEMPYKSISLCHKSMVINKVTTEVKRRTIMLPVFVLPISKFMRRTAPPVDIWLILKSSCLEHSLEMRMREC